MKVKHLENYNLNKFKETFKDFIDLYKEALEEMSAESQFFEEVIKGNKVIKNNNVSGRIFVLESKKARDLLEQMIVKIQKDKNDLVTIKNLQEILVFVIQEKLLPAQDIRELTTRFLDIKSKQKQPNNPDIYELEEVGNNPDINKLVRTVNYNLNKIDDLILNITSSHDLNIDVIENALSCLERDSDLINKEAIISALETRIILDPKSFLCLKGRVDLIQKLSDLGVDVVGVVANQLGKKELALEYVKIGFNGYLTSRLSYHDYNVPDLTEEEKEALSLESEEGYLKRRMQHLERLKLPYEALRVKKKIKDISIRSENINRSDKIADVEEKREAFVEKIIEANEIQFENSEYIDSASYGVSRLFSDISDKFRFDDEYFLNGELSPRKLDVIKDYFITHLESRVFDERYSASPKEIMELVKSYIVTQDNQKLDSFFKNHYDKFLRLESDIDDLIKPSKLKSDSLPSERFAKFIKRCITPITNLTLETDNIEIVNIIKNNLSKFYGEKYKPEVLNQDKYMKTQFRPFKDLIDTLKDKIEILNNETSSEYEYNSDYDDEDKGGEKLNNVVMPKDVSKLNNTRGSQNTQ